MRRSHGEVRARKTSKPEGAAQRRRLPGMYRSRAALGGIAPMSHLRECRLLRLLPRPARHQTLQRYRTSGDAGLQVRRLEVVLCARGVHVIVRWLMAVATRDITPRLLSCVLCIGL